MNVDEKQYALCNYHWTARDLGILGVYTFEILETVDSFEIFLEVRALNKLGQESDAYSKRFDVS